MKKSIFICILIAISGMLYSGKAGASQAAAGELMYKWVSGSTYDLYLTYYRDCSGTPEPAIVPVCYTNTCNNFQDTILLNKISGNLPPAVACGNGIILPSGCPGTPTTCQNPNATLPGYEENWYYARITLPSQCNFWRFSTAIFARNPAITNLANPATAALYLEATLYSAAGTGESPGNSSPCFTVKPVPYLNSNIPFSYNMGAVDPDGDSLVYQLILPRTAGPNCTGTNLAFKQSQFNLLHNPFHTGNTFWLNSQTGQIAFTSTQTQVSNIAILVKEYQNGVLRGTTIREIQMIVLPGIANNPPQPSQPSTITGGQYINGRYEGYAGQLLQFCFKVLAADTSARLMATDNHNNPPPGTSPVAPGASLVYNNPLSDSLNVCFSWTPTINDTGLHNLVITVRDTVCHPPGFPVQNTFALPVYINPIPTAVVETASLKSQIRLSPNPTSALVTIENTAAQAMKTIRILDVAGALVQQVNTTRAQTQQVDVSMLAAGTYLVRIELADGAIALRKLQVKH